MQETQETWVQSLGQEDPLEEGTATHSSMLAWRRPWAEEPGGLQSVGSQSRTRLKRLSVRAHTHAHTHTHNYSSGTSSVFTVVQATPASISGTVSSSRAETLYLIKDSRLPSPQPPFYCLSLSLTPFYCLSLSLTDLGTACK